MHDALGDRGLVSTGVGKEASRMAVDCGMDLASDCNAWASDARHVLQARMLVSTHIYWNTPRKGARAAAIGWAGRHGVSLGGCG